MTSRSAVGAPAPTRWSAALFTAKVMALRLHRAFGEWGQRPPRLAQDRSALPQPIVAQSRTPLWSDARPAEREHQLGKVHNLRQAIRMLDGLIIPAGATFSFWRHVGRASRRRGFVPGRMLQQGCMVPALGGGLCQLSNALYDAALQAGCAIVERHAHSRAVPGSAAVHGRDATVAWNYVDLRFRPAQTLYLAVRLTADELVLALHGTPGTAPPTAAASEHRPTPARTCATCDEVGCFHHERRPALAAAPMAFLVDEAWPEFLAHTDAVKDTGSRLGLPRSDRFPGGRATWSTGGLGPTTAAPTQALARSLAMRLAQPGAARRRAEAQATARIARALSRMLTPDLLDLWVAQSYLPTLWRDGHLGGRRFSVLMTRPPMHVLHARLDAAFAAHPDRATLADYRAPADLVRLEAEALAQAEAIATPHSDVAALFPGRAVRLAWSVPPAPAAQRSATPPRRIAFPGPTLARKGAYELRDAARALDIEVLLLGADLEGAGFWRGVRTHCAAPGTGWLTEVAAVVQPALVEERPRPLLAALAAGVPVVATPACGLDGPGVIIVPALDVAALIESLRAVLGDASVSRIAALV